VTDTAAAAAEAQSDALRAADADRRWQTLQKDIQDACRLTSFVSATNEELDAHFAADRRVQAAYKAAGQDVGDLVP